MKTQLLLLAASLSASALLAGPLKKEQVPADAKWVIHLDVDAFIESEIGTFIGREILDHQLDKATDTLRVQFNVDFDWHKIQGVTLFGTDFKAGAKTNGVLLIQSSLNIPKSLDAVIDKLAEHLGGSPGPLRKLQTDPFPLYTTQDGAFGAPVGEDLFLVSKSREQFDQAREVLKGKGASLSSVKNLPSSAKTPDAFLVVAVMDTSSASAALPPQAKALKETNGGQIVAGEKDDKVFLSLSLVAKDAEAATQMQQAVQGLIALAALSQSENKDVQQLVQAAKVGGSDKTVTLNVEMSVADVKVKLGQFQKKRAKRRA